MVTHPVINPVQQGLTWVNRRKPNGAMKENQANQVQNALRRISAASTHQKTAVHIRTQA